MCPGTDSGEFTPSYMRLPWTAGRLKQAAPDTLLICVLRDPIDRILVFQFEALVQDPATAIRTTWAALGLEPVPLPDPLPQPTMTANRSDSNDHSSGLDNALAEIYLPEVKVLAELSNIDPDLWTSMKPSRK